MRKQRTDSVLPAQSPARASLNPAERSLRARIAAHAKHGRDDTRAATARARAAFLARFERAADPDGVLPPDERQRRADHLRKAYFAGLALASAKARRRSSRSGPNAA
jgi:hypothetical protein